MSIDPSPDLAIEIDITARTRFDNYELLGVPELWRYNGNTLEIDRLQEGHYVESTASLNFPRIPVQRVIPQYLEQSRVMGRTAVMRAFRAWLHEHLG